MDTGIYTLLKSHGRPVTILLSGKIRADLVTGSVTSSMRRYCIPRALVFDISSAQKRDATLQYIQSGVIVHIRKSDWSRIAKLSGLSTDWGLSSWVLVDGIKYETVKTVVQSGAVSLVCRSHSEDQV